MLKYMTGCQPGLWAASHQACVQCTAGGKRGKKGAVHDVGKKDASDISKIVRMIMARQFDPVRPRRYADHTIVCVSKSLFGLAS